MFEINERVLCVDGNRWGSCRHGHPLQLMYCPNLPLTGRIYTVRKIWDKGLNHLWLVEITNPGNLSGEPVFECKQFVPLKRKETDISVFTGMLNEKASGLIEA